MRTGLAAIAGAVATCLAVGMVGSGTAAAAERGTRDRDYLIATTSADGQTLPMRWNPCQERITYQVNVAGAGATESARRSALEDVQSAFEHLSRATGIAFSFTGETSFVPTGRSWPATSPAEIVVAWIDDRAGRSSTLLQAASNGMKVAATGGYSFKRWTFGQGWTGATGRGFVVVDAHAQNITPGFGDGMTRGNLLLHELGHVMGLKHIDSTAALMHPVLLPRSSTGYRDGDLAGLAAVGTDGGCIDVPSSVWTDL